MIVADDTDIFGDRPENQSQKNDPCAVPYTVSQAKAMPVKGLVT